MLTALLLGALFCWGNEASAYTYSGQNITITTPNEDENELIVTGNSQLISTNNINTQKVKKETKYIPPKWTGNITITESGSGSFHHSEETRDFQRTLFSLPNNPNDAEISQFNKNNLGLVAIKNNDNTITLQYNGKDLNSTFITSISYDSDPVYDSVDSTVQVTNANLIPSKTEVLTKNFGDAAITVTESSSLTGKAGVQTTKAIKVDTNSKLNAAGAISGGNITADASIITGASITSNQELSATNGGSINAINGNLTANHITVATGSAVNATGTITTGGISANNGKIKAGN